MKDKVNIIVIVLAIFLLVHSLADDASAANIYLKIVGIDGESLYKKGWIDVLDINHRIDTGATKIAVDAARTSGTKANSRPTGGSPDTGT